jgi:cell division septum initiation protein DivIVA
MVKGGSTDMPKKLTDEIVKAAIDGFTAQKARLNQRIAELRAMLNGGSAQPAAALAPAQRKGRRMSAAARRRIAAAQRARWAKLRGESEPGPAKVKAPRPKRRISEEGMKRIIAATKKRWRLQRAAAKRKAPARKAA